MNEEEPTPCAACGGVLVPLGALGRRQHYRCRDCGLDSSFGAEVPTVPDENPRWTCCRAALGRAPRAVDFLLWMSGKWDAFADENNIPHAPSRTRHVDAELALGFEEAHRRFDAWLKAGVEAGRWQGEAA